VNRGVVVADTDVFLDYLEGRGAEAAVTALLRKRKLATTAVTVFEVWRGLESAVARREAALALRGVRVYAMNAEVARRAAELQRQLRGNEIGDHDTMIAGTCLAVGRPLLTRNVRHFQRVPGLELVQAR
jgi:predicted nucleic acid-binding protein